MPAQRPPWLPLVCRRLYHQICHRCRHGPCLRHLCRLCPPCPGRQHICRRRLGRHRRYCCSRRRVSRIGRQRCCSCLPRRPRCRGRRACAPAYQAAAAASAASACRRWQTLRWGGAGRLRRCTAPAHYGCRVHRSFTETYVPQHCGACHLRTGRAELFLQVLTILKTAMLNMLCGFLCLIAVMPLGGHTTAGASASGEICALASI